MLVPLPQAFAVDRGSMRGPTSGWPNVATPPARSCDRRRSGPMASSSNVEPAGTSSSGASSEISPTLADTSSGASEYDDCPGDLDDPAAIADLNAAARELDPPCQFTKNPATDTTDEGHRACVCSIGSTCPEGKVCADAPNLRPAP